MIYRSVNEIDAAEQIVCVIEMFDEMAQTLGGVGGKMEDVLELVFGKEPFYKGHIGHRTLDKLHPGRHVVPKTAAQVVQSCYRVICLKQMPADVRADKSGRAGNQNTRLHLKSLRIQAACWRDFFCPNLGQCGDFRLFKRGFFEHIRLPDALRYNQIHLNCLSQQNRKMKTAKPAPAAVRSLALAFPLLLLVILCALWAKSFIPGQVAFSNDGPLGEQNTAWQRFPGTLTGSWDDLNDIGIPVGASSPTFTSIETWLLGPVGYSKFYVPIALFILGIGAWTFFRQLKLSPLAATLGALATALNGNYVGNACWGTAPQQIAMAATFFALALVMANTEETPRPVRWLRLAMAGMAVGVSVMEGADNGAIFSLFVAGYVFFKSLIERSAPALEKIGRGIGRVAVIAVFAGLIAAQTITSLFGAFAPGAAGTGQNSSFESPQEHWDWATEWSLPKIETLGVFVPGVFGYRLDTPTDMSYLHDFYTGGEYWGGMGRTPAFDRFFDSHPGASLPDDVSGNGMMRFGYAGYYAGILVVLVALFAMAQSFRKDNSIFPQMQRRFIWFWMAAMVIALLLSWGRFAPFYQFLYMLPYFSTIRNPGKFMAIFHLALVIIFAYGMDGLSRRYLQVATGKSSDKPSLPADKPASMSERFKNWWAIFAFDRNWILFCIGAFVFSVIACGIYNASSAGMIHYLQKVGFPDSPDSQVRASQIFNFSVGQVQWFLLFFAVAIVLFILILSGVFSGKGWWVGGLLLGTFIVIDLGRADLPWIIHWDYKLKYDIVVDDPTISHSTNPIINILQDKPYEHRITDIPGPGMFESLYRIEWMQHHFPYYNIQCSDIIQSSRVASDIAAYDMALRVTPDKPYLILRRWELTNTRYFFAPANYLDSINDQADPVLRRFHYLQRFSLAPKPGFDNPTELQQITAVKNTNGDYALIEFSGALPRAKLYTHWEANSPVELKSFTTNNLDAVNALIFGGAGTNGFLTLQKLTSPNFNPDETVLLDTPLPGTASGAGAQNPGTVDFKSYAPKDIVLSAQAAAPSVLLLNDRYDPNWHVLVDGKPAPLLRCNFIMRGVYLPSPGSHTVEFKFEQPYGPLYVTVTTMFLGILLGVFLFSSTRKPAPGTQSNLKVRQSYAPSREPTAKA